MLHTHQPASDTNTGWRKPDGRPLFLAIDGSNVYYLGARPIQVINERGEQHWNPEHPNLKYVEAIVAFCLKNKIEFHLYFDAPAPFHFKETPERPALAGLSGRFKRLQSLKNAGNNSMTSIVKGRKADSSILEDASDWNSKGYESYIVTADKFSQTEYEKYADVMGKKNRQGWPERVLLLNESATPPHGMRLSFSRFPGAETEDFFYIPVENSLPSEEWDRLHKAYIASFQGSDALPPAPAPEPALAPPTPKPKPSLFSLDPWPICIEAGSSQVREGGASIEITPDGSWSMLLGRDDATNHAKLHCIFDKRFEFVSGQHLKLDHEGSTGRVTVTDMSTNGTWLGLTKLVKGIPTSMSSATGILTLSGSDEQPGALPLTFYLANISCESDDESGQSVRVETKARMLERQVTQHRKQSIPTPDPVPPPRPVSTCLANDQLILHIEYPNGTVVSCSVDTRQLPFCIGSTQPLHFNGTQLQRAIAPGVASTHIVIKSIIRDRSSTQIRAVEAECANMPSAYAVDEHVMDEPEFVWNVGRGDSFSGNCVTLAPKNQQFGARLWLSCSE